MKINFIINLVIKKIISIEIFNIILRNLLKSKYIFPLLPEKLIEKVPVSGIISWQLPNFKRLYLKLDGNDTIANRLYWKGINGFESDTLLLFMKLLKYTNTVLDIGANTGIYSLIAATDNHARKVYAFEPVPRIFKYLKRNVDLNKADNLQIDSSAITNYNGEVTLYIPSAVIPTGSSTSKGFREANEAISVRALTLDSFVTTNDISKVDLIKIDTETTEHLVLEGGKNVLERDEPIIICEVLKGKTEKFLRNCSQQKRGLVENEVTHKPQKLRWTVDLGDSDPPKTTVHKGRRSHHYLAVALS